ncbi:toxic anion resistance protein [Neomegalonema perideroedes]|uniref:toxic anion resistance protein n=1 Tax=Neomegalonema perideroedes TaxID=217219 RepID=UPI000373B63F|nr:toxic anion resistance protein [Neomegalonema perideroedes]
MPNEDVTEKARVAVAEAAETLQLALPAPKAELITLPQADPRQAQEIRRRMQEIDLHNTQSIIKFGSKAQEDLTQISDQMLEGVRNKDVGPAGGALRNMVGAIRGFDVNELGVSTPQGFFARIWNWLFGKASSVHDFVAKYEQVRGQIDKISDELLGHETILLKDIKFLDKLYESSLAFYDELALYIAAGEAKIADLDANDIPAKEREVQAAPEGEGLVKAQELRDLRAARDELERRVHDLKLTRQVTMQSLPSIRLVQENDKSLVNKINSTLVNTVPLWQTQLAQAVTIHRSREAAGTVKAATDLTNDLLKKNAENLQQANREIREQMERGVFDIETVKEANQRLIATIEESLTIADEGKKRRAEAERELLNMENELKRTLSAASARKDGVGDNLGTSTGRRRS